MAFWIRNIRKIVLILSISIASFVYFYIQNTALLELQNTYLVQTYALLAVTFLYLALLASPLYIAFPTLPLKPVYIKARQALGVSAFIFSLAHALIAFFELLGGFRNLVLLDDRYLTGITLSFTALVILTVLAITSLRYFHQKLGAYWKWLHRLVYVAGFLILTHALMLGSDFADISGLIPRIFGFALFILLLLEAIRVYKYIRAKFPRIVPFDIITLLVIAVAAIMFWYFSFNSGWSLATFSPYFGYYGHDLEPHDLMEVSIFGVGFFILLRMLFTRKTK